jgi:hypothetical protein
MSGVYFDIGEYLDNKPCCKMGSAPSCVSELTTNFKKIEIPKTAKSKN